MNLFPHPCTRMIDEFQRHKQRLRRARRVPFANITNISKQIGQVQKKQTNEVRRRISVLATVKPAGRTTDAVEALHRFLKGNPRESIANKQESLHTRESPTTRVPTDVLEPTRKILVDSTEPLSAWLTVARSGSESFLLLNPHSVRVASSIHIRPFAGAFVFTAAEE